MYENNHKISYITSHLFSILIKCRDVEYELYRLILTHAKKTKQLTTSKEQILILSLSLKQMMNRQQQVLNFIYVNFNGL